MFRNNDIKTLFENLKPVLGEKKTKALWLLYHSDSKQKAYIESIIHLLASKHLDKTFEEKEILLSPIPKNIACGKHQIGTVTYINTSGYPFGLSDNELLNHLAIFGRSGSGKTNVAHLLLHSFLKHKKPFLVFDWKRNYRDLLKLSSDIHLFTIGRNISPIFWNPLIPPHNIEISVWIKKISLIAAHAYFLGDGVIYLLTKAIDTVYKDFDSGSGSYPTFKDIYDWINRYKAKGREGLWLDSTKRTLAMLCYGEFGKILNANVSIPIAELLNKNVIMELDSLTKSDKIFFIEALLLWIHHYRMCQNERDSFRHSILIEEAHHILLKKKQELQGEEAITDIILREIRELGEAIILIDQHPSLISKPALGNTYTTIAMNLKHHSDVFSIADSLLLKNEQKDYLGKLPVGTAIVKLQDRWYNPFLVNFPVFPVKKGLVTDKDIQDRMSSYFDSLGDIRPNREQTNEIIEFRSPEKEANKKAEKHVEMFINDVQKYPFSGIVERYNRLGLNSYQGNKIKQKLIKSGRLVEESLNTGKAQIKILRSPESSNNNPGLEHEYWKFRIADHCRNRGYCIKEEYMLKNGHAVDLVAIKHGRCLAIEIETGKSDAIYNIKKDLEGGFNKVYSVCLNIKTKEKLNCALRQLQLHSDNRIKIISLKEIL